MHKWQHLKVRFRKIGADHCFIKMCASLITDKSVFSFRCCSIRWWVVEGVFLENLKNVCKWPHFVNKLLKLLLAYASFCYSFGFFRVFVHTHIHTYIYFSVCKVPWDDFWFGTIQKIKIDWLSECHSLALRPQQNRGDQMICQCKRNIYLQKWSIHTRKACQSVFSGVCMRVCGHQSAKIKKTICSVREKQTVLVDFKQVTRLHPVQDSAKQKRTRNHTNGNDY